MSVSKNFSICGSFAKYHGASFWMYEVPLNEALQSRLGLDETPNAS